MLFVTDKVLEHNIKLKYPEKRLLNCGKPRAV